MTKLVIFYKLQFAADYWTRYNFFLQITTGIFSIILAFFTKYCPKQPGHGQKSASRFNNYKIIFADDC